MASNRNKRLECVDCGRGVRKRAGGNMFGLLLCQGCYQKRFDLIRYEIAKTAKAERRHRALATAPELKLRGLANAV